MPELACLIASFYFAAGKHRKGRRWILDAAVLLSAHAPAARA
jgi:hypothetical protein